MLVLNRLKSVRTQSRTSPANPPRPCQGLQAVAVGLGTAQLLLDIGEVDGAKETLRAVRSALQTLRRSQSS